ncbi:MAG: YggT family protein [Deltaproteobacteria bacterium]|jgi:YggT family protein|nr:YggT family protein [Deltaproteobacteria bacterium]
MFVLANLLNAFAQILHYVLNIYMWIIIIRALLSWVNPDPYNPIVRFLYQITEPVLDQVRKRLPYIGGIDISPIIVIFIIWFLQGFLVQTISDIALRMRIGG